MGGVICAKILLCGPPVAQNVSGPIEESQRIASQAQRYVDLPEEALEKHLDVLMKAEADSKAIGEKVAASNAELLALIYPKKA